MLAVEVLQENRRTYVVGLRLPERLLSEAATDGVQRMPRLVRQLLPEAGTVPLPR
jgi:hypothetical protein